MRIQDAILFHVGPDARKVCSLKGVIFLRNLEWPCAFILISDSQVMITLLFLLSFPLLYLLWRLMW